MNGAKSQGWPPTAEGESGDITLARPRGPAGSGTMAKTRSSLAADIARGIAGSEPAPSPSPATKAIAVGFFQWWWNQPGANTEQGFDEWAAGPGKAAVAAAEGRR